MTTNHVTISLTIKKDSDLVKLFNEKNITIYGTTEEPLFSVISIRNYVGCNSNDYRKTKLDNIPVEFIKIDIGKNVDKKSSKMLFLTEKGVYLFIMQYNTKVAQDFKLWMVGNIVCNTMNVQKTINV